MNDVIIQKKQVNDETAVNVYSQVLGWVFYPSSKAIKDGIEKYGEDKEIIVCMHYPPFNNYKESEMNFIATMKKYNVKTCIYGHLHGEAGKEAKQGKIDGIDFKLASCDQVEFKLQKI